MASGGAGGGGASGAGPSAGAGGGGVMCSAAATEDWGRKVVDSTNARLPTPADLGGWEYSRALYVHGQYLVYTRTKDPTYLAYVKTWADAQLAPDGTLGAPFDSLDSMMPGQILLDLFETTKDQKYKVAADAIRQRLDTYPRTTDGAFWHATVTVGQTWGDGTFMVLPFLSRYGQIHGDAAYANAESAKQLSLYHEHLKHPTNGLHYHAWDEQGDAPWTTPATKHSDETWGRAVGWYAMAMVQVLDGMPPGDPGRPQVLAIVQELVAGFAKNQDKASGRWFQVVDRPDHPDNWLETSCSSMFTYATARAVKRGWVDASYLAVALKGYEGVLSRISLGDDGLTNLTDISVGTNVGDLAYYLARPRATNDFHGLGAFLIMQEELRSLCNP
jgi:unsaturated rhamnogalacturonyl hydrolase